MRKYVIDELPPDHVRRLGQRLQAKGLAAGLEGMFWLPVPEDMLTPEQREHLDSCGPYALGLELLNGPDEGAVHLELLVRARSQLRCSCIAYASPELRHAVIEQLDAMLRELDIPV